MVAAENLPDTVDPSLTPVGVNGQLSVVGSQLVNANGEAVQLRGVSSMWLNWENSGYATSYAALQWMRDNWGVQVIRAAMGVSGGDGNPVQGGYLLSRSTMESQVGGIVDNAIQLGVYVIIDWHDHYAQNNLAEAQEFFGNMAARYADAPNVLYETFNEPITVQRNNLGPYNWGGDIKPYHEAVVGTIRQHDPDNVIILGTPNWSQYVDEAAANPVSGSNLMYTLHFYSCTHGAPLRNRAERALQMGLPIFVTEWGATDASGGVDSPTICASESDQWHAFMDQNSISWAAWKLDDCDEGSCLLSSGAPVGGNWNDRLQGHGPHVVSKLTAGRLSVNAQ